MTDLQLQVTWDNIIHSLEESLSKLVINNYFKNLKLVNITEDVIELVTPNDYTKEKIERSYLAILKDSCSEVLDKELAIILTTKPDEAGNLEQKQQEMQIIKRKRSRKKAAKDMSNAIQPTLIEASESPTHNLYTQQQQSWCIPPGDTSTLNSRYTFESFVIGSSNEFAHAAALAISERPGLSYNPFFMYGGVGLGKTHLMHAIGNRIIKNHPNKRVLYITSEKFTNEFIRTIRSQTTENFRQKYRNVDVLLIDDIQFLAQKDRIQEEFFHTFNDLKEYNKQIVITSDRPPKEIKELEARLCSRFEGGLLADVQTPDLETRIAILQKKSILENLNVPKDVMTIIAQHIDNNIRDLEGALNRVVAYASFNNYPITNQLAMNVLKHTLSTIAIQPETKQIDIQFIQEIVAQYFKISLGEMNGKKRNRNIAFPRQIAMFLAREITKMSLPRIGKIFGGRDHTTVMHACNKIKKVYVDDEATAEVIDKIRQQINQA